MEEKMRLTKQLMDECLKLYDKHFPTEKNAPLKEKKTSCKVYLETK